LTLLEVKDLSVSYFVFKTELKAVQGVSLELG
jgi:ABC-type dipeptide/oligopeptide/nickel transport system ATPase component